MTSQSIDSLGEANTSLAPGKACGSKPFLFLSSLRPSPWYAFTLTIRSDSVSALNRSIKDKPFRIPIIPFGWALQTRVLVSCTPQRVSLWYWLGSPGVGRLSVTCTPFACARVNAVVSEMPLPETCAPAACA